MDVVLARISDDSVALDLATLSLAVSLGLIFGAIRVRGMRLGISGVLFSSLIFGQFGLTVADPAVLKFLRDFALIIFIYALGLQVGPGFVASLKAEGLRLNTISVAVLVLGAVMALSITKFARLPDGSSPGIYAGAFTSTPALAAGQDSARQKLAGKAEDASHPNSADDSHLAVHPKSNGKADDAIARAGLAYSVSYPFGVVGPILVIVMLRRIFKIDLNLERKELAAAEEARRPPIEVVDFEVTEAAYAGQTLSAHPLIRRNSIILSRLLREGTVSVPTADTIVTVGDIYRAIGTRAGLAELVTAMGRPTSGEMGLTDGDVQRQELFVTRTKVLRKSIRELDLIRRHGVTIGRLNRAGVELVPKASLRLAFADRVTVIGPSAALKEVEQELGNCPDSLNRPQLVPIFLGIVLGVMVGSFSFPVPFMHTSLRIGLAGGPLLAAILLSQMGNVGSLVWYMPVAASALFRDFGLAVFLACVGLSTGDHLIQQVHSGGGFQYVLWGGAVTIVPVAVVGFIARRFFKMNFLTLSGWVAGAMTSSPALSFANDMAESDAPAVAYAAVAPLATLVPIICAQLLGAM